MIPYFFKKATILFVGINPHYGSFERSIPFSNNKLFWYLLARAGLIQENEADLREDSKLKKMYMERFNRMYHLGFVNIVDRPTRVVTELEKGEEESGRTRLVQIIKTYKPPVVCFIGKITYQKFTGNKKVSFGWQKDMNHSKVYVMHFPLHGKASVRVEELKMVAREAQLFE
ncbi:MAG TPA: hypothetical protein DCY25_02205 [Bacteroidales bacterium]|jgi:TDG/mug DNA glycosylase family protein|nr:hypothetical protein [Bacteroidales bacterium]